MITVLIILACAGGIFLTLVALGLWALFSGKKTLREELFGEEGDIRYSHIKRDDEGEE